MNTRTRNVLIGIAAIAGVYFAFLRKPAKAEEPVIPPPPPPPPPDVGPSPTVPAAKETTGPAAPIPAGSRYTIKPGESLSNLAERTYGNYRWWPLIWDANVSIEPRSGRIIGKYKSPDAIPPGAVIVLPSKATLPMAEKDAYFARAKLHAQAWAGWKGRKGTPPLPDAVLYKSGKAPAVEVSDKNIPPAPLPNDLPPPPLPPDERFPGQKLVNPPPAQPKPPVPSAEDELNRIAQRGAQRPTGGRAGQDQRAQSEWDELPSLEGFWWRR